MTSYSPLSSDGTTMVWHRTDGSELEKVSIRWDNEAWTIDATLTESRANYVMRTSPLWHARQLLLFRDLDEPDLWLGTDGQGRWGEVNGAHRPDLDGATGLHVDDSVFSLAIQVLRLPIDIGHRVEVPLAHVDTETLAVTPTRWWFERLSADQWRAELSSQPESAYEIAQVRRQLPGRVEFGVDEHGVATDAVDLVKRSTLA